MSGVPRVLLPEAVGRFKGALPSSQTGIVATA
ncbi:hypothetical protein LAUMK7_01664 [Mycobacterium kansasii]|uniref:Uncharacterized protein n=1 Tax=Mycobacterium kansasii TaxID=1768 RepID=A0A653F327_MYCKA|nr:hypothetical protein MKANGN_02000 [Mycobacterium kansasii]VAZ59241.1 hypothetical protein LAUMK22_01037 [Mycobacterium kansasii]VAZ65557.1 hypothetical protein LAUMK40_01684 [Mycobacterium kansasii]VAZ73036.1 hypothetical protein LAUMK7_01664 [Mycobacterium kansasii]VTP04155.1 hypothetical protein BIN_B_04285 [Mycobacterium kansasii]